VDAKSFAIISLGCARNLVDSEVIAGSLKKLGMKMARTEDGADVFVINTCAFIDSARRESIDAIVEAARAKARGKIRRLVICGCLPQGYRDQNIAGELREADLILGTSDFPKLPKLVKAFPKGGHGVRDFISGRSDYLYDDASPRFRLTPPHYAYVKISEGCSNSCSYCIISRLRGPFRSRKITSVIKEIEKMSGSGTALREINLIGQDTTLFGLDIYGKSVLPQLLREIRRLKNSVRWIRLLYTHPAHYTDGLISTIRDERKICRYLDLPIQHASDKILKAMNRRTTKSEIAALIDKLRKRIPALTLRTSVIVGFPGETDKDFKELLTYIRRIRFERLGAFIYSKEDRTRAARMKGHVPVKVKGERLDELMRVQQKISAEINRSFIGKTVEVLLDEKLSKTNNKQQTMNNEFLGRTEGDAPEIDCGVYVSGRDLKVGEFRKVRIADALEYDLVGEAV
jgi:ribosomal protein S12 methylthiotransferase